MADSHLATTRLALLCALCITVACGDDAPTQDASVTDAAVADAGPPDGPVADGSLPDATPPDAPLVGDGDEDADGCTNDHEGASTAVDTDGDGMPDYLDPDSDNDTIPDVIECGPDVPLGLPSDSDGDQTPDFRDLDSDDSGVPDEVEGALDLDADTIGDWIDPDNDNDALLDTQEVGPDPANPLDSDGDGRFDYNDVDSDNDVILDAHELLVDPDMDTIPAFRDTDSDGDCVLDIAEAGDATLATPPVDSDADGLANPYDLDSDNDRIRDADEDVNCSGAVDAGETSPYSSDSDSDGAPELIEVVLGTSPTDPAENPATNGDVAFLTPFQGAPEPAAGQYSAATRLLMADVYVLLDRSGSMAAEISSIILGLNIAADNVICPPLGNGDPSDCVPDVWWGAGTVGYSGIGGQSYTNHVDLQPNAAVVGASIPTSEPGGCCDETLSLAMFSTATALGAVSAGCAIGSPYPDRATCVGSPAGAAGVGFPCFRDRALPVIVLGTDEPPTMTFNCPLLPAVSAAINGINGKLIGLLGSSSFPATITDLNTLATSTGAVDATNGNAPVVVLGANGQAAFALENALRLLFGGMPLDVSTTLLDDPNDAVDAVAAFVERIETLQLGTAECPSGLLEQDTDADGFPDQYVGVPTGTSVCWRLIPGTNTTVPESAQPQVFQASGAVRGEGLTPLDSQDFYFIVPPPDQSTN